MYYYFVANYHSTDKSGRPYKGITAYELELDKPIYNLDRLEEIKKTIENIFKKDNPEIREVQMIITFWKRFEEFNEFST